MKRINELVEKARQTAFDFTFSEAKKWKTAGPGRLLAGYLPVYIPREVVHAANGMPVGLIGAGDHIQIIRGDAYYQSYICHLPRGVIEMLLGGSLDAVDAFIFPPTCDVIRNLSGIFKLSKPGVYVKYLDFPQNFEPEIGGHFYRREILEILEAFEKINGVKVTPERLNHSIRLYNHNRQLIESIYNLRQHYPWRMAAADWYCVIRAGMVMPVEEHNRMLEELYGLLQQESGEPMDKVKVVLCGAFCEQPPLGLIRTIEMAGCYIVDDDLMQGTRWISGSIEEHSKDPLDAIVDAYLTRSTFASSVYDVHNPKEERLVKLVHERGADGVIFASPSFCDPALLDRPLFQDGCEKHGIRYISLQYSENTGQFKVIREQVGAFSDSIKLWEDTAVATK